MPNPTAIGISLANMVANLSSAKPPPLNVQIYIRAPAVKIKSEIIISDAVLIKGTVVC